MTKDLSPSRFLKSSSKLIWILLVPWYSCAWPPGSTRIINNDLVEEIKYVMWSWTKSIQSLQSLYAWTALHLRWSRSVRTKYSPIAVRQQLHLSMRCNLCKRPEMAIHKCSLATVIAFLWFQKGPPCSSWLRRIDPLGTTLSGDSAFLLPISCENHVAVKKKNGS